MEKIMFVSLALTNGGAERVVSVLSETLLTNENEVYILLLTNRPHTYQVDERIHIITIEHIYDGLVGKVFRILGIRKAIKQYGISTVIAFSHYNAMYSVIAAAGLPVKIIGSERNDPAQIKNRIFLNRLREVLYRRLDALVCQTEDAKAYFSEEIRKKTVVIPNPVSDQLPEPFKGRRAHRVVSLSRLEPQKNIPMLIRAFALFHKAHKEYKLDIYGDGSLHDELLTLVQELGLQEFIHLYPFSPDVHTAVLDAAMFAMASDYEGLSNAMIEAMGMGIPTIVTDCPCGGGRMIIDDGYNGLLVPVGDFKKMAEAMARVADDHILAEKLSRNGIEIRNTLDKWKIAAMWSDVIDRK